jgi:hypothetical protein
MQITAAAQLNEGEAILVSSRQMADIQLSLAGECLSLVYHLPPDSPERQELVDALDACSGNVEKLLLFVERPGLSHVDVPPELSSAVAQSIVSLLDNIENALDAAAEHVLHQQKASDDKDRDFTTSLTNLKRHHTAELHALRASTQQQLSTFQAESAKQLASVRAQLQHQLDKEREDAHRKLAHVSQSAAKQLAEVTERAEATLATRVEETRSTAYNEGYEAAKAHYEAVIAERVASVRARAKTEMEVVGDTIRMAMQAIQVFDRTKMGPWEDMIIAAVRKIGEAMEKLVDSAEQCQTSIDKAIKDGSLRAPNGEVYHDDGMWAEGLVSCARFAAQAISNLGNTASEALQKEKKPEALTAACRIVTSSTAQLVLASGNRCPDRELQGTLSTAGRRVQESVEELVEMVRSIARDQERRMGSMAVTAKAEIEAQMKLMSLEGELEEARRALSEIRRLRYAQSES